MYLVVRYSNYLISIFMNIDEILKMGDTCRKSTGVPTELQISQLLYILEY